VKKGVIVMLLLITLLGYAADGIPAADILQVRKLQFSPVIHTLTFVWDKEKKSYYRFVPNIP